MEQKKQDVVVPVLAEDLDVDAVPVKTGGVRVIKHREGHDQIVEQELRKGHVQVKRVKTDRIVDGPQPVRHAGNTVIVPVVSEVLRVEKQWVVTEEIHITQVEQRETVQQKVRVNEEHAEVERLDEDGNAIATIEATSETEAPSAPLATKSIVDQSRHSRPAPVADAEEGVLLKRHSILKEKHTTPKQTRGKD